MLPKNASFASISLKKSSALSLRVLKEESSANAQPRPLKHQLRHGDGHSDDSLDKLMVEDEEGDDSGIGRQPSLDSDHIMIPDDDDEYGSEVSDMESDDDIGDLQEASIYYLANWFVANVVLI